MLETVLLAVFLYALLISVRRLYFHPLKTFPGPTLAALTTWYCGYYDVIKHGALLRHIEKLHQQYGPVVRIGPNELSFCDPKAFPDIFAPGSKFTKEPKYYACFGVPKAAFGLQDVHTSKMRRNLISPLFSRRAILGLEGVVQSKVDHLVARLSSPDLVNKPVNMPMAFRATAFDIITAYCLDQPLHALDYPEFDHPFISSLQSAIPYFWLFRYIPLLSKVLVNPPEWLFSRVLKKSKSLFAFRHQISDQIDKLLAHPELLERPNQETIYDYLIASPELKDLPPLSREELFQEVLALLLAGSDTTGTACTVGLFYILDNPLVLQKLVAELEAAWPSVDSSFKLAELEKLPYLSSVLKESLRLAYGVVSPMPRVVGPDDAFIGGYHVPAKAIVSMSPTFVHNNPEVFHDPLNFIPERWLDPDAANLEESLVSFSRGPRSCLGLTLARAELYLIFGNLFRKLNLKLFDTTVDDIQHFDAFFVSVYSRKPLQVMVQNRV